jgi:hypothetical protein
MNIFKTAVAAAALLLPFVTAQAQVNNNEISELRRMVDEMKTDYETRIAELEERLARAERAASGARLEASEAVELAEQTAIDLSSGTSAANTFNPSIGAILGGRYADVGRGWEEIPGFQPAGEIGTGESGFGLGEAEINLKANVDAKYFGNVTVGLHEDEGAVEVELEEAWVQTMDLPAGISVTGGRFFSASGYLNGFHFHADDFADRPLPYQAFFGGRHSVDGIQARWVAPTSLLVEIGTEFDWGGSFPATANAETSAGSWTAFTKIGGDIGDSHSWQFGLSHTKSDATDRGGAHAHAVEGGEDIEELFSGDSDLTVADFVWKWAPDGNTAATNFKLQGEYFRRSENGLFGDVNYDGDQDGWYLQGVWQFRPLWRVGLRHDVVDTDNGLSVAGTELEDPGRDAYRNSLMLDWSPSEFSRIRMQYTSDRVFANSDNQWYLQYIMSLGAHGAHQF